MNWTEGYLNDIANELGEAAMRGVVRRFTDPVKAERDLTLARVARISQACHHITYSRVGDAGMIAKLNIPEIDYHGWAMKFADDQGNPDYTCWSDHEFVREYWRDNPQLRCVEKSRGNRIFIPGTNDRMIEIPVPKAPKEAVAA